MAQAKPDVSRIPSGVTLTNPTFDAAEIAAKNNRARLSIGREVEKLLRIRREADEAAFRLIELLDLAEPDPDLEPDLGGGYGEAGSDRELDDAETLDPDLGWLTGINQASRNWFGRPPMTGPMACAEPDGEADDSDREPSLGSTNVHVGYLRLASGEMIEHGTFSQSSWARGTSDDREWEHDGCEPEVDKSEDCAIQYHGGDDLGMDRKAVRP